MDDIGADENFFDLGGQSLLMIQVHQELQKVMEREISIVAMFQYPTIRDFVQHLEEPTPDDSRNPALTDRVKRQSAAIARNRLRAK